MKKNILIVAANENSRKAERIRHRGQYNIHYFDLHYSSRNNIFDFDILGYLDKAREYIKNHKIDGIFYHLDIGTLIGAKLCEEFNLPGPSFESVFLVYNKYYTRVKTDHAIAFDFLDLSCSKKNCFSFPFYLKAPCSSLGVLGYKISNEQVFNENIVIAKKQLPNMINAIFPLFEKYVDLQTYPLATKPIMMVEELIKGFQITVEGFVYNNEVFFTVITDTNLFSDLKRIDNFSLPTVLSEQVQEKIKAVAVKDVRAVGLNNTFFNCEYWIGDDAIILIEINGRAASAFYNLYKQVYNYDVIEAGIQLCLGQKPNIELKQNGFGAQCNIVTIKEGNSSNMVHYDKLPKSCSLFIPPNNNVMQFGECGRVIAQVELFGQTYAETKNKADAIRKRVMKV